MKLTNETKRQQAYIRRLKQIAEQNKNGFTICYKTLKPIDKNKGFLVSITQNKNGSFKALAKRLIYCKNNLFKDSMLYVGGWYDNGLFYLDLSIHTENEQYAIMLSKTFKQLAYFNLKTFQEVRVK